MNRRTKSAILGAAGAALSAAAIRRGVFRAIDRNMVGEALDREEPKTMLRLKSRMKGYAGEEELEALLRESEEKMRSFPHEDVVLTARDGTRLTGHLYRAAKPKRAVIAMHGWRSSWARDFCMIADFLRENDCTVLYPEQRGQGESDGDYMGFGMLERYDCLDWVLWMEENGFDRLPIYLAGISMGASTVLMASGFPEMPKNVKGIIADCGFTSPKAIWKHISEENLHISYDRHGKYVDQLCRKRLELDSDGYSTLEAMETNVTPILFVHGTGDTFVPHTMTQENYDACRSPKRLLLIDGANHGLSYLADQQRYENAVKAFWQEQE